PAPVLVLGPVLGQVELPVDESMTVAAGIACKYTDLAVLDPSGGPGILTADPDRVLALLQEPGLVDHQHAALVTERVGDILAHEVSQMISRPRASSEQR